LIRRGEQSALRRDRDVRGLPSLRTFDHIELHLRALLQRAETAGLNRTEVDEHILAPVSSDEAKAFRIVEPLDGSGLTTHLRNSRNGPGNPSTGNFFEKFILCCKEGRVRDQKISDSANGLFTVIDLRTSAAAAIHFVCTSGVASWAEPFGNHSRFEVVTRTLVCSAGVTNVRANDEGCEQSE